MVLAIRFTKTVKRRPSATWFPIEYPAGKVERDDVIDSDATYQTKF